MRHRKNRIGLEQLTSGNKINITVIGFGYVGSSLSLLLLNNKHPIRLNVMETNPKSVGAFLDLAHGISLYDRKELHVNQEELFLNADFIYYAAGIPNIHGSSRLSTAKQNLALSKEIFEHRNFVKNPYIIAITNPVDIVANAVHKNSGLPSDRVFGTGTFLDSVRLAYNLSSLSGYNASDFGTMVLGEHGNSQVPIYSQSTFKGKAILKNSKFRKQDLEKAADLTKNAAFQIRETQAATSYGVSKCAEVLLDYLLGDEEHFITLSMLSNDYYRTLLSLNRNIYLSMPVRIKNGQISIIDRKDFLEQEIMAYQKSASILAEIIE